MGAKLKAIFVILFLFAAFLHSKNITFADNDSLGTTCQISIGGVQLSVNAAGSPDVLASSANITASGGNNIYDISVCNPDLSLADNLVNQGKTIRAAINQYDGSPWVETILTKQNDCYVGQVNLSNSVTIHSRDVDIEATDSTPACKRVYANFVPSSASALQIWEAAKNQLCDSFKVLPTAEIKSTDPISIAFTFPFELTSSKAVLYDPIGQAVGFNFDLTRLSDSKSIKSQDVTLVNETGLVSGDFKFNYSAGQLQTGAYSAIISMKTGSGAMAPLCSKIFLIGTAQNPGGQQSGNPGDTQAFALCEQAANEKDKIECQKCVTGGAVGENTITDPKTQGYWTAFGCVKTSKEGIVTSFIRIGLGISGGFVLLSILYGAFLITTSSGDPKRVQEGQEMVTSAVMGLVFVIFSIIILRFIGVSLFQIPGFGT